MAVVFAMMTSYLLSRTLVPTMVHYLLAGGGGALRRRARPKATRATPRRAQGSATHSPLERRAAFGRPRSASSVLRSHQSSALAGAAAGLARASGRWVGGQLATCSCGWASASRAVIAAALPVGALDLIWRTHYVFNAAFETVPPPLRRLARLGARPPRRRRRRGFVAFVALSLPPAPA